MSANPMSLMILFELGIHCLTRPELHNRLKNILDQIDFLCDVLLEYIT